MINLQRLFRVVRMLGEAAGFVVSVNLLPVMNVE